MSQEQGVDEPGQTARILLVENSKLFQQMVGEALGERLDIELVHAHSLAEAAQAIDESGPFTLVLTGLVLADGDQEKIVDFFLTRQLPTVIVTGVFDEQVRKRLLERPIIDYVLKNAPGAVDYLVWLVQRLDRNRRITALVVDDAPSARMHASALLGLYGFRVVEADGGESGLKLLAEDSSIRLVITDQEMPGMDGVEFTRRLRALHPRDTVSVIGVSGAGRSALVAQFLKNGANDFLHKPFSREEFFCRVSQNVENLELIGSLQDLATKDFLTGLANRRHFFDRGAELMAQAKAGRRRACVAMLDIDLFKRINDSYGHDGGDVALKAVSAALARFARPQDLVARFGGEEFAVLAVDLGETEAEYFFEGLRARIENLAVQFGEQRIPITTSIGVCVDRLESLDAMLTEADRLLYLAKAGGRNQVRRSNDSANAR
jgi:diguanylate cyclase (GGDEF)-like protein